MATGSLTAAGATPALPAPSRSDGRDIIASLYGTFVGTVQPERSFDAGANWLPMTYIDGSAISWTAPVSTSLGAQPNALVRLNCTSYTSGTINWRID